MCYSCRELNEFDANEIFIKYNIDLKEYTALSNSVFNDLYTDAKENTHNCNNLN